MLLGRNSHWQAMSGNPQSHPLARPLSFWLLLGLVVGGIFVWRYFFPPAPTGRDGSQYPAVGRKLDFLRLEPLTGQASQLSLDDLEGQVTVINYWGPWCPPCRMEFPHLHALKQKYGAKGQVQFAFVSCSGEDGVEDNADEHRYATATFLREQKADTPTYYDAFSKSRRALMEAAQLEDFGYPTTVVLDQSGAIRGLWQGYMPGDEVAMHRLLDSLVQSPKSRR